jgi:hypothetical protein
MLKDVVLKDFELDTHVFNVNVADSKVVDIVEAGAVVTILNVAVVTDGTEKWMDAVTFFEVVDVEISESVFADIVKATIPVHIFSLDNYEIANVLELSPGQELLLKGRANVGLPEENAVVDVTVSVELMPEFFETLTREFAGTTAEGKLARRIFKQTAQEKHIPPDITVAIAEETGTKIGIKWEGSPFDVEQFKNGMIVELEHGLVDAKTNVTNDDLEMTGKIALAHLKERADYYKKLDAMEKTPVEK